MKLKKVFKALLPPLLYDFIRTIKKKIAGSDGKFSSTTSPAAAVDWAKHQELLEWWGRDSVWNEIQMLLVNCNGKVLDIGCGTGATMSVLSNWKELDIFGCDISEELIAKCIQKGIDAEHLKICSATDLKMYPDNYFDYSYSIGLLQYIHPADVHNFTSEIYRVTRDISFHNAPISASEKDEGLIKNWHSYINNSTTWWKSHFLKKFAAVKVIDSSWKHEGVSTGKWFVCYK